MSPALAGGFITASATWEAKPERTERNAEPHVTQEEPGAGAGASGSLLASGAACTMTGPMGRARGQDQDPNSAAVFFWPASSVD